MRLSGEVEDKMQGYFGDAISTRLSTTPEGFLVAQQARLCRSGWQTYRPSELNLPGSDLVEVYRPPEEVLAPAFLASLEGKCLTDAHPTQFVDSSNARWVCCGHCQNVRVAPETLNDGDRIIVGDLIVMDESLIRKIENGKRELSVGYEYRLTPNGDGTYSMSDLVANHISLVDQGRAGSAIRILDHALEQGRPCHCPRELARVADRDDVAEVNFEAAAKRFLGKNIMEVRNR
jgi:hypothetical protein